MGLTLVVLAAGMGSRFGGMKQVASVDDRGHTLVDYGVFDAVRAGFDRIICVVTPQLEADFHERVGRGIARHVDLAYAYQTLDALPAGREVPPGRVKPWGTGQAVLVALPQIDGSFATINADDFYGADAHRRMAAFLRAGGDRHALVGYRLVNTLSQNGTVSRGVCQVDAGDRLVDIREVTALHVVDGGAMDQSGVFLDGQTIVSLNFWGFGPSAAAAFRDGFEAFLDRPDAATAEYYLPDAARRLIPDVAVLPTSSSWLGVTYADDLPGVRARVTGMVASGEYPEVLWP